MRKPVPLSLLLPLLSVLVLLSIAVASSMGSVSLSFSELLQAVSELLNRQNESLPAALVELRLHRALSGFVTGASLALSGLLMQALLRNPLADPYVLGISSGASVGALGAIFFLGVGLWVSISAFAGALIVAALLFAFAYRDFRGSGATEGNAPLLILTGVVIASFCGAIVTLLLSIAPDRSMRGMIFWMIGDLSNTPPNPWSWILLAFVFAYILSRARAINIVAMHAEHAMNFGVEIGQLRKALFFCAALLTASAVSASGSIGFVGLIIPHACRIAVGSDHRILVPTACLVGGCFLVLADALARTLVAPQQLPVGVITAMIGVPLFLMQLHRIRMRSGA
jgi:iron complex transport system permease protein